MEQLFASGRIVDLILVLVALEAFALIVAHRMWGIGPRPADLLPNLAAGALLLLAVRSALLSHAWTTIALCLGAALAAHLVDLWRRLQN